jgi:hypothetical protein
MVLEEARYVKGCPGVCGTLVIDTADWAEKLCVDSICAKKKLGSIEELGGGKGYVYLEEEFGRFLNALSDIVALGAHIVFTAHAAMRKFELPDELGAYDRWEMKLQKKTVALLKEWADMVLFANYETFVVNVDGQGARKGKNKASDGQRVMHTSHHPCWDAKNRHGLESKLAFDFNEIRHCLEMGRAEAPRAVEGADKTKIADIANGAVEGGQISIGDEASVGQADHGGDGDDPRFKPLYDLMELMDGSGVSPEEIQEVVSAKGYYPKGTEIADYDQGFIEGVLVAAWGQVYSAVLKGRGV